jgi:hypothetical protein
VFEVTTPGVVTLMKWSLAADVISNPSKSVSESAFQIEIQFKTTVPMN